MARVTLEGSITPSTFLARGARVTVERTPYVEKLIRKGYVVVIGAAAAKTPVVEEITRIVEAQQETVDNERQLTGAPARNASREDWADFMTGKAQFNDYHTRTDLIQMWDELRAGEDTPEAEDDGGTED